MHIFLLDCNFLVKTEWEPFTAPKIYLGKLVSRNNRNKPWVLFCMVSVSVTSNNGSELPSMHYITGLEGQHPSYLTVALQQAVNDKAETMSTAANIKWFNSRPPLLSSPRSEPADSPLSLSLSNPHVHKSNVNMQTACLHQPQGTDRQQLCAHRLTSTTQKQMTGPFISPARHNTVPPNHLSSANMTELRLKLWLLDDDTLRGRRGKLAPQKSDIFVAFLRTVTPPPSSHYHYQ